MKKDDNGLGDALKNIMGIGPDTETKEIGGGGTVGVQQTPERGTTGAQKGVQQTPNRPPARELKKIRLDDGDFEKLQEMAIAEGTTAAALIRRAVKELIRRGGK